MQPNTPTHITTTTQQEPTTATKKAPSPTAVGIHDDAKWRAEDDMRTLARAREIEADPKRLVAAKKMAREKLAELQAVAGTK